MLPIKPALCAGFLFLGAIVVPVVAQDYVDVEAERRAAAENLNVPANDNADADAGTYAGIRPYSGSTTVAAPPAEAVQTTVTGNDSGSLVLRVQQLEADVRRLNGLLEEANQALTRLEAQSLERYVDLDRRIAAGVAADGMVEGSSADSSAPMSPTNGAGEDAGPEGNADPQVGEEAAYRAAYELVREKSFDEAVTAFLAFLADFPFGRYAPNAHYWLGELYLVLVPPGP